MHSVLKSHIEKNEFGHGYLLAGDFSVSEEMMLEAARAILGPEPKNIEANPDFLLHKSDSLGIKDSQEIILKASQTPLLGSKKVIAIETSSFTPEAGNALLKTLEEPHTGTHFFIIVPSIEVVLPTLRSRLIIVENPVSTKELVEEKENFCREFTKSLPNKRMDQTKDLLQDRRGSVEFLNDLEVFIAGNSAKKRVELAPALEEIQKAKKFIYDRSSNLRMILEHLALALPKM